MASRTILLQGEPGCGKSMMAGLTAVKRPVHFIDIDRKIMAAAWAEPLIIKGEVTVQEIAEPIDDTNIAARLTALAKDLTKKGPSVRPSGFVKIAEAIYSLPKMAASAGTWVIDSCTLMNEHMKAMIAYDANRSKFTFDLWTALKIGWMDTVEVARDIAKEHDKDLIFTVHERIKEEPGDRTTGIRMEAVKSGEDVALQKTYLGTQDVKVWASIDGAYGDLIGAQMDEYYWLYVEIDGNKTPHWRCRVLPDGRRSLRTSFDVKGQVVWEPDFRKIWGVK